MDLHEVIRLAEQTAMGDHRKPYRCKACPELRDEFILSTYTK